MMAAALRLFAAVQLMSGALLLLLAILPVPSAAQRIPAGRLPASARCLGAPNATATCIKCSVVITVDSERGTSCGGGIVGDLNGRSCSELEPVVQSIATGSTEVPVGECVLVQIVPSPQGEAYTVEARESRVLQASVVFRGVIRAEVRGFAPVVLCMHP